MARTIEQGNKLSGILNHIPNLKVSTMDIHDRNTVIIADDLDGDRFVIIHTPKVRKENVE